MATMGEVEDRVGGDGGGRGEATTAMAGVPAWPTGRARGPVPGARRVEALGVLFVGDPHVGSRRPGRRRDADFTATVIGKLQAAIDVANRRRLVPVLLGDLLDRGDANDVRMLVMLTRALRSSWTTPIDIDGNHTLTIERHAIHAEATDRHTISMIKEAGLVRSLKGDGSPEVHVVTPDGEVVLGGVAYGRPIPGRVGPGWDEARGALRVLVTHHDLSFPGRPIPKSAPLKRIAGIDLVVNGHVHDRRPPVLSGGTWWFNPGNVVRLSIDLAGHVPTVYAMGPREAGLGDLPFGMAGHVIPHDPDAFDHQGRLIAEAAPVPADDGEAERGSAFVAILEDEVAGPRTEDGSVLGEELERIYEDLGVAPDVRRILDALREDVDGAGVLPGRG